MPPDFNSHCELSSGSTRTFEKEVGGDDADEDGDEDEDEDEDGDEEGDDKEDEEASARVEKGGVPTTVSPR